MSMQGAPPKAERPCKMYFGNVCGGFGAITICDWCKWDLTAHRMREQVETDQILRLELIRTPLMAGSSSWMVDLAYEIETGPKTIHWRAP